MIGSWFGTGTDRGLALLFTVAGLIGLAVTLFAMRSYAYRALSERYENEAKEPEMAEPSIA
jgi:DHA3 family multidrug efflux protein-like MFS transporter